MRGRVHFERRRLVKASAIETKMKVTYLALQYSFVCLNPACRNQFEVLLRELFNSDFVPCPKCSNEIDIRQSKKNGDLAELFTQLRWFNKGPR